MIKGSKSQTAFNEIHTDIFQNQSNVLTNKITVKLILRVNHHLHGHAPRLNEVPKNGDPSLLYKKIKKKSS